MRSHLLASFLLLVTAPALFAADPAPTDACLTITLAKTIEDKPLNVYLATANGKVKAAVAQGYNIALHTVDASALTVDATTIKGPLKITINPDAWLPKGKKPVSIEADLNLTVTGADLAGTAKIKIADKTTDSDATGKVTPAITTLTAGAFDFVIWGALADGQPHLRDAQVTFSLVDGKPTDAKIAWRKKDPFHWTGKVDSVDCKIADGKLNATIDATITSSSGVLGGKYTFSLEGDVIGPFISGKTKVLLEGKDRKQTHFFGTLKDAK